MKKLIALMLILATLILAVGCKKDKYPEIKSTKEEARVMMSFEVDGDKYEMKYELYRALFLNFSQHYDKGDKSFWDNEDSKDELAEINTKISNYALDIFATLHLAKKIGFDPYSDEAEKTIREYITESVEGSDELLGFGGDYDAYIDSLAAANMNYSVHKLILRYSIAYEKVIEYYTGTKDPSNPTENKDGSLKYDRDSVDDFYNSEDAVRVSRVIINATAKTYEQAKAIRDQIAACSTTDEILDIAVRSTATIDSDVTDGILIGTYTLDEAYYKNATDVAFALGSGETSEVITVVTDSEYEYWVLYGREKTDAHFNECYEDIESAYISQQIGKDINSVKMALRNSATETDTYKNLKHSEVKMK